MLLNFMHVLLTLELIFKAISFSDQASKLDDRRLYVPDTNVLLANGSVYHVDVFGTADSPSYYILKVILTELTTVSCFPEHMVVRLGWLVSKALKRYNISLDKNPVTFSTTGTVCQHHRKATQLYFPTLYSHCGTVTEIDRQAGKIYYFNKVQVWPTSDDVRDGIELDKPLATLEVLCGLEMSEVLRGKMKVVSTDNVTIQMTAVKLAEAVGHPAAIAMNRPILQWPEKIHVGSWLNVSVAAELSDSFREKYGADNVRAVPFNCFLSRESHRSQIGRSKQRLVLMSGCPADSDSVKVEFSSASVANESLSVPSQSFQMKIMHGDVSDEFQFLHCTIILCADGQSDDAISSELIKCPAKCDDTVDESAFGVKPSFDLVTGALDIQEEPSTKGSRRLNDRMMDLAIAPECGRMPQNSEERNACLQAMEYSKCNHDLQQPLLFPLEVLSSIAFASFAVGILLMLAICWVHDKTRFAREEEPATTSAGHIQSRPTARTKIENQPPKSKLGFLSVFNFSAFHQPNENLASKNLSKLEAVKPLLSVSAATASEPPSFIGPSLASASYFHTRRPTASYCI